MRTFKLTLAYDGTNYSGWQSQPARVTLQDTLERALAKVTGEAIRVVASGRTDAGVHALGQVVSFRSATELAPEVLQKALNAELPHDMAVRAAEQAADDFHAIASARRKRYRYLIADGPVRNVFRRHYAWQVFGRLDEAAMHRAAQALVGRHDFSSFETAGSERETSVRTVFELVVARVAGGPNDWPASATDLDCIRVEVEADGFLYNMVRAIVGTLVEVGQGKRPESWPAEVLQARDRRAAGRTAPPEGLLLLRVDYSRASATGNEVRMRIVHLITRLILGGAQENTLLTCEDLLRTYGDDVLLVTGPALGPEGSLLERARNNGVPLEILPSLRREIHPLRDPASYFEIKRAIARFRPEVVHTHSGKAGLLGRMAAHALRVEAIVHTVHGAPFHPYQSRGARAVFRACERYAAARSDALVSVADAMTELMVEAGVAQREKFTTIYSGMEVEPLLEAGRHRAQVRRELGYRDEHVVIGKIARLFHLKGHEDVVRAARAVVDAQPNVRFLVVGDGILAEPIRGQIRSLGLDDYFQFTGLVAPERIPPLVGAIDIVVHASLREGLARVLPQALIAGKPVVSYDVDGAREVVINGETGFLVPPRHAGELAATLERLAADPVLREKLGAEGRARFTDQFRHEHMTREIRALYERVLSRKRRTPLAGRV